MKIEKDAFKKAALGMKALRYNEETQEQADAKLQAMAEGADNLLASLGIAVPKK